MDRMRHVGAVFLTASLCASIAEADEVSLGGGHVIAAAGVGADSRRVGARLNLDAGIALLFEPGWLAAKPTWADGWLLGASVSTGFGVTPTYILVEGGWGGDAAWKGMTIGGCAVTLAGVARVDPCAVGGVGARFACDVFFAQIGLRALSVAGQNGFDGQAMLTYGLGHF